MRHLTLLWALLIAATLISLASAHDHVFGLASANARAVVIYAIALIKARFVILYMMDVQSAPVVLRVILEIWVVGMWITLSVLHAGWL